MQIKNNEEHKRLLSHLENLLKKNPQPGNAEVDQEIETLVQALSEYEDIHFPIVPIELAGRLYHSVQRPKPLRLPRVV